VKLKIVNVTVYLETDVKSSRLLLLLQRGLVSLGFHVGKNANVQPHHVAPRSRGNLKAGQDSAHYEELTNFG
jgi:hypothetical protein